MAVRRIPRRRLNGSGDSKARARDVASAGLQFPGTGASIRAGDAGIEQITNDRPTCADACRAHPALARGERPATDDPRRPARHRDDPGRPAVERDRSRPAEQHPAGHVRDCRARRIAARRENGCDRCARRRAAARCRGLGATRCRAELPDAARDDRGDVIGCRHHAADHADGCTPMAAAAHRVRDGALHERAAGRRGAGRAADSAGRVAARRRRLAIVARCVVGADRRHRSSCAPVCATVIGARDEPRAATAEVAARLARRARMATWRALLLRQCHLLQRKRFSPHLSRQQGPRRSHQPCPPTPKSH